jgi:aspartate aminotransferase
MKSLLADRPILTMTSALGEVIAAARAREAAGHRVHHLERGEPDFDTPPHIVEALAAAARSGETHYPDSRGNANLRSALVEKLRSENGIPCEVDDVVVTVGGTHALFLAFQGLLGGADEMLVLSPYWMAIPKLVAFTPGSTFRSLPAYLDLQAGTLDRAGFADRLRGALTPRTRGIYLNSPNNPTGVVLTRDQLEAIAEVAIERDLWVISDEAYEHILLGGARHISLASLPGMAERTVSAFTFSKTYAMTGWRLGYVVSPPSLRAAMGPLLSFYTTHGVFPAVQTAGAAAVTGSQEAVEKMRSAYERRRGLLLEGLAGQEAIRLPAPQGAVYAFADVSVAKAGRDIWDLVREWLTLGVAVLPGTAVGKEYGDWVRMSLASCDADIEGAAKILRNHYAGAAAGGPA